MKYEVLESREFDPQAGLISGEAIKLIGYYTSRKYPDNLRLVVYEDFRDGLSVPDQQLHSGGDNHR